MLLLRLWFQQIWQKKDEDVLVFTCEGFLRYEGADAEELVREEGDGVGLVYSFEFIAEVVDLHEPLWKITFEK